MNQEQYNKLKDYIVNILDTPFMEEDAINISKIFEEEIKEPSIDEDKVSDEENYFKEELKNYMQRFLRDFGMANKTINDAIDFNMPFLSKDFLITLRNKIDKVSDDELLFKIKPLVDDLIRETEENDGVDNNIQSRLYSDELVKIFKQYSNTKLDELEKWIDEQRSFLIDLDDLKAKIKTLK